MYLEGTYLHMSIRFSHGNKIVSMHMLDLRQCYLCAVCGEEFRH
jgi:hypothetical protein